MFAVHLILQMYPIKTRFITLFYILDLT